MVVTVLEQNGTSIMKAITLLSIMALATGAFGKYYFPETPLSAGMRRRPKIVGGEEVEPHSLPYQVGLFLDKAFCGGSLITKRFVLTAAHCAVAAKVPVVVMGAHEITKEEPTQVLMKAKKVVTHRRFDPKLLENDIAVIELPSDAPINDYIQIIKLTCPHAGMFVGHPATVSGWGRAYANSTMSPVLRSVESTIISNKVCSSKFHFPVEDEIICLDGSTLQGSCNGDSGGPLVVKSNDGAVVQIGVVSFGSSAGCEKGFPTAYTRLTHFIDWISNHTDYKSQTY